MDDMELQAEIYRVVRANQDKPKSVITKMLREHFKDIPTDQFKSAFSELCKRISLSED